MSGLRFHQAQGKADQKVKMGIRIFPLCKDTLIIWRGNVLLGQYCCSFSCNDFSHPYIPLLCHLTFLSSLKNLQKKSVSSESLIIFLPLLSAPSQAYSHLPPTTWNHPWWGSSDPIWLFQWSSLNLSPHQFLTISMIWQSLSLPPP